MKKIIILMMAVISITNSGKAQRSGYGEKFGNTLNVGLGIGYYGYYEHSFPVIHFNYEFDAANNFTLAPFLTIYSYHHKNYRQTVLPIGVKGSYYFDRLLQANSKWDFYLAASLGFAIINTRWYPDYDGMKYNRVGANPLYLDLHIGTEYHFNRKIGAFLDLSTGVSTVGLSFHK